MIFLNIFAEITQLDFALFQYQTNCELPSEKYKLMRRILTYSNIYSAFYWPLDYSQIVEKAGEELCLPDDRINLVFIDYTQAVSVSSLSVSSWFWWCLRSSSRCKSLSEIPSHRLSSISSIICWKKISLFSHWWGRLDSFCHWRGDPLSTIE